MRQTALILKIVPPIPSDTNEILASLLDAALSMSFPAILSLQKGKLVQRKEIGERRRGNAKFVTLLRYDHEYEDGVDGTAQNVAGFHLASGGAESARNELHSIAR